MQIVSWNVAGLRAMIKKEDFRNFFENIEYDIICLQETKALETEVILEENIKTCYPYRFWNSNNGLSQRKGLSGTCIWCKYQPIKCHSTPKFDIEGRIITLEFEEFILINVYVPNSQKINTERYNFRNSWNNQFLEYLTELKNIKNIIICGDMNVAHKEIDISNPKMKKNKVAGFFDFERIDFTNTLNSLNLIDVYRYINPDVQNSTYWSNFLKSPRTNTNGWRIDYFLISKEILDKSPLIKQDILNNILGSDHCPIVLKLYAMHFQN